MPNLGVTLENSARDVDIDGKRNPNTGGYVTMGTVGVEACWKKILAGFNAQIPLAQNLSDGQIRANSRAMVHLTWMF
ncbi:MAG: hypothetical protein LH606_10155 [Cytophagaceae bacterium]|nr:hypothetical protein [Cytophagaceae bacterium]